MSFSNRCFLSASYFDYCQIKVASIKIQTIYKRDRKIVAAIIVVVVVVAVCVHAYTTTKCHSERWIYGEKLSGQIVSCRAIDMHFIVTWVQEAIGNYSATKNKNNFFCLVTEFL